jgi:hypothetical protein
MRIERASRIREAAPWLALWLIAVTGVGCANLAAIREFASTSADSAAYTRLVTEYVESPAREKRYQPARFHADLDRRLAERRAQQARLLLQHRLIQEYMETLGQLAADDAVVYDKEINALGQAATGAKFLDAKEADAFSAITRVLAQAAADGWRRRELARLIEDSNVHFQTVVNSLKDVVERGFAGDAGNEREAMNRYYQTLVLESGDKAGIAALREWQEARLAAVKAREDAIAAYARILEKIGQGHQRLYEGRGELSARTLLADMTGYSKDMRALFAVVRDRI